MICLSCIGFDLFEPCNEKGSLASYNNVIKIHLENYPEFLRFFLQSYLLDMTVYLISGLLDFSIAAKMRFQNRFLIDLRTD